MPSLRDVADRVGVSVSLVSKVLNNRMGTTGVRPDVVEKVHQAAKDVGYRKNHSALSLLERRQNTFAVMLHRHGSAGSGLVENLLDGIGTEAHRTHKRTIVQFFNDAEEFREKLVDLHTGFVDGVLISGVQHLELIEDIMTLREQGLAVITVHNTPLHPKIPNVGVDQGELFAMAVRHLLTQGCRRILALDNLPERTIGYRIALKAAGMKVDPKMVIEIPESMHFQASGGRHALREAVKMGLEFDGVAAQSDAQAIGVEHELIRLGTRIPEDVRIIGIDDSPLCDLSMVPLTSISQRFEERGRIAVQLLEKMVEGGEPETVVLEPILEVRESSRA